MHGRLSSRKTSSMPMQFPAVLEPELMVTLLKILGIVDDMQSRAARNCARSTFVQCGIPGCALHGRYGYFCVLDIGRD